MGTISNGDEPGKLRIGGSEKISVAFRCQVVALGLQRYGGKKRFSARAMALDPPILVLDEPSPDGSSVSSLWKLAIKPATASASDGEPARMSNIGLTRTR